MAGNSTSQNKVLAADNIIENHIFNLNNYYDIYVDVNHNWQTKNTSRSLRRWLHTHIFLTDFTRAYVETKDQKFFDESYKLLTNWIDTFPIRFRNNIEELAYHDEGTAIRLLFWFKYYNQFYDFFEDSQRKKFENQIDETANLLFQDEFYAGLNNHGMFQDMSLIAYSIFKYENFEESDYFSKAIERIVDYFKEVFTSEGIHKEHAPSYHVLILYSLKGVLKLLRNVGYKNNKMDFLEDIFNKGEKYTVNIVQPDYKLPAISDSIAVNLSTSGIYKDLFDSEYYKFITSGGEIGTPPNPLIIPYPETGYLIARDKWERTATYFLFLASYHMHYHKHTDDLSFILYKNGPIFIDAGPHSYDYKDPYTLYAYSQFAHSTLVVNNYSLPRTDYKFEDVFITDHEVNQEEQVFVVEGVNNRFTNASHTRRIEGDLKSGTFEIVDQVISKDSNQYKVLFQINGDLNIIENGNIFSIFKNNTKIAEMEIKEHNGLNGLKLYIISEQNFPQILGYQFPKTEGIKPAHTVVIESYNNKNESILKTDIRLNDFKIKGNANFNKKDELKRFRDITYVYEDYGFMKLAIVFSSPESEYNYRLDNLEELKEKGFNILYLIDNQSRVGSSFLQGESSRTIETDVLSVISNIVNKNNINSSNVYLFGRSKGGFAALYYALISGYNNLFISTPLVLIGDYYARHEKFEPMIKDLGLDNEEQLKFYLNDYFSNINISKLNNINICVGEKDYHKKKHVGYLTDWLDAEKISYNLHNYPGAEFKDDKIEFINFLKNYEFEE